MKMKIVPTIGEDLEDLSHEAAKYLKGFFGRNLSEQDLVKGRVASSLLSTAARHRQTERAWAATAITLGRLLTEDTKQYQQYLRATAGRLPILKELRLPEGGNA